MISASRGREFIFPEDAEPSHGQAPCYDVRLLEQVCAVGHTPPLPGRTCLALSLVGFAISAIQVGTVTVTMDICPAERRATHLAIIAVVNLPSMLIATGIGGLLWTGPERYGLVAGLAIAAVAASLALTARLREPRGEVQA